MHMRNQRGFTLMELMVVIVIVAILAAVAVPLYINYVRDAQRTEAKGAIGAIITAEQTYFQQHQTYVDDAFSGANGAAVTLNCDVTEAARNWTFAVTGSTATGFVAAATGRTTDLAGRSVTLTYSRTAAPIWVEQ